MDMLQIYVVFSFKTTIHVQYLNKNGHLVKTCSFFHGIWFHIKVDKSWNLE